MGKTNESSERADRPTRVLGTKHGAIWRGDSLVFMRDHLADASVDLIMTSPPFGLVRKKDYGNVDAHQYVEWFLAFGREFKRVLRPQGSLVIDIGGAWIRGQPTRSLYHFELLIALCRDCGFHLAQEFFWWNPARLPTPAEWVTVRRIRVKDAVNCVWWLSPTPWPKASNRRILQPYSDSMRTLLQRGYQPKRRPSGHDISDKFGRDNGAAIPPNLIAVAHTESNSAYIRYCRKLGLAPHPARFPRELPEFFIRMLTDAGDLVFDPFAGSCVTGEAAERTRRRWACCEIVTEYVQGAAGRFAAAPSPAYDQPAEKAGEEYYRVYRPGRLWNGSEDVALPSDGGRSRPKSSPAKEAVTFVPAEKPSRPTEQLMLLEAPPRLRRRIRSGGVRPRVRT